MSGGLRLLPLGTRGFIPTRGGQTMSFLVEREGAFLLLDAGSGVARLAEPGPAGRLAGAERLDVVLTHYHLDHVIGLSYLPGVARHLKVTIHAPAPPLTEAGPEAIERLISPPLFPHRIAEWPMPTEVVAYRSGPLEIGPFALEVRAQRHPGGSVGLRVGDSMAYVTDTVADPATVAFVKDVDLLLHEVWLGDGEGASSAAASGHSAAADVAEIAARARVRRVALVHHHPGRDAAALEALRASIERRAGLPARVLEEGVPLDVG
ncbi:MAG: MBL fold metallo-hydrolase [Acidobacteria bacterium]|nr:MBL fold metallo-hydrolase [Acidobacteriota bacterium]MCB9378658.1 MBL fold metallo-hydrolase [Holophagales bacterium]